jgi:Lrp/AsnC family transcriptional regulator
MDAIDRKILGVLQQDASLSVAEVGNRVGLSPTPAGNASRSSKPKA